MSERRATSSGVSRASTAPPSSRANACALPGECVATVSGRPAFARLRAMPAPIVPRPMNPIRGAMRGTSGRRFYGSADGGSWYAVTMVTKRTRPPRRETPRFLIERVQTGVRMEKRILKVLKALAELKDMSLGDLLEGICLHAFDGKLPFSEETRRKIAELKKIYGLDLDSSASHLLREKGEA